MKGTLKFILIKIYKHLNVERLEIEKEKKTNNNESNPAQIQTVRQTDFRNDRS